MTDALRRRCLHAFLDYPSPSRECRSSSCACRTSKRRLARQLVASCTAASMDLRKAPSISETIDWARALLLLGVRSAHARQDTLGLLLKCAEIAIERTLRVVEAHSSRANRRA